VFSYSDDGEKWKEFCVAVHPDKHDSRVFDASLWIDPLDRLWLFWSQACEHEDGRMGVWFVRIDNPDDGIDNIIEKIKEATPKRIGDGIKLNKPVVLSDGSWMFASVNVACDELDNICVSVDDGESWVVRSSPEVNGCQHADEPMILEVEKGRLKTFVRSTDGTGIRVIESSDNGYTWTKSVDSGLDGPCSRFHIRRLSSGKVLLINHYAFTGRSHLTAMLSEDDGKTWPYTLLLDERTNVAYPDGVEAADGYIYITYDRERGCLRKSMAEVMADAREILMAKITEADIMAGRLTDPGSKLKHIISKLDGYIDEDPYPAL
jgi:hypothetical protein